MPRRPLSRSRRPGPARPLGRRDSPGHSGPRAQRARATEYFDEHERATLQALCDRVIPQDGTGRQKARADRALDRPAMQAADVSGFRFDDMPPDEIAWDMGS